MALKEVGVKMVVEGLSKFKTQIGQANKTIGGFKNSIMQHRKAIGLAIAGMGAAAFAGAVMSVKAFAQMGDEVQKMGLRTKWATESLSELRHVAQISGTDLNAFEKGTRKMSKAIVDASDGLETYLRDFRKLGLDVQQLKAMKPEDAFWTIAESLSGMENEIEQSALALNLFGRTGSQLFPMLAQGAEGIRELRQEAHDLGIVFDQEAANKAAEFTDNMARLEGAVNGVKFALAEELMPALEEMVPIFTQWTTMLGPVLKNILNWHQGWDKAMALYKTQRKLYWESLRVEGGLTNTYWESLDAYITLLEKKEDLTEAEKEYIKWARESIPVELGRIAVMQMSAAAYGNITMAMERQRIEAEGLARALAAVYPGGLPGGTMAAIFGRQWLREHPERRAEIYNLLIERGERPYNVATGTPWNQTMTVEVPVNIDGREVARVVTNPLGQMVAQRTEVGG